MSYPNLVVNLVNLSSKYDLVAFDIRRQVFNHFPQYRLRPCGFIAFDRRDIQLILVSCRYNGNHLLAPINGKQYVSVQFVRVERNADAMFMLWQQVFILWGADQRETAMGTWRNCERDNEVWAVFNGDKFNAFHSLLLTDQCYKLKSNFNNNKWGTSPNASFSSRWSQPPLRCLG